jgi:hypothetical protein
MENMNKKFPGQGKTTQQYKDSMSFFSKSTLGIILLVILMILTGCSCIQGTCDHPKFDRRQYNIDNYGINHGGDLSHVYYHNDVIYYGYHSGWYYYYGKPHYYPWHYYYSTRPPFYYDLTTHILVNILVNKPTYRPIIVVKPNRPIFKPNRPKNTNIRVKNNNTKVIIKNNNGSKRTNTTKVTRRKR